MFLIQQAELRSSELRKEELGEWKGIVKNANEAPNQKVNVEISAYASPDGGLELNEKLAAQREKNTNTYLSKELQKSKVNAPISAHYTAQDWEGFKELLEKSNIQDKDLVLRVLSMYPDPERREQEIKNISSVFSVLADEILPQLRRSRLTANVDIIGKSDEEISSLVASNPKALNVEEILYAASLVNANAQKETIYKKTTELYPNDSRAFNNLGVMEFENGNIANAESYFNKALQMSDSKANAAANCNLGLVALTKGDKAKATQYFGSASGVSELNNAMGVLSIMNGDYSKAVSSFGSTASNNAALAQILTKDYNKAQSTLNAVKSPDATTAYLKAIVAARTHNTSGVVSNLKQAISTDKSLATKALTDLEFVKYATNSEFLNLVR
jgi:Flp pilus assembly protein TadD